MPHSPLKRALPAALVLIAATPLSSTDATATEPRTYAGDAGDFKASLRGRSVRHIPKLSNPAMAIFHELCSAKLPVTQPQPHTLAGVTARAARIMVSPTTYVAAYRNQKPPAPVVKKHLGEALAAYFGVGIAGHAPDTMKIPVFSAFEQVQRSWEGRRSDVDFKRVLSKEAVPNTDDGRQAASDALDLVEEAIVKIYR